MTTEKIHYCASCRQGENKVQADAYVVGKLLDTGRPYRAFLCEDHITYMDGWDLEIETVTYIPGTQGWINEVHEAVKRRTAYSSLKEMRANNPTLRAGPDPSPLEVEDFRRLRAAMVWDGKRIGDE